mmetsp:Transcript_10623/g.44067  ORF Transcript_10623/g.44067 Transcript_10623/m.44067 type:complete len:282 (-) Transcript_10623:2031-2876(-)
MASGVGVPVLLLATSPSSSLSSPSSSSSSRGSSVTSRYPRSASAAAKRTPRPREEPRRLFAENAEENASSLTRVPPPVAAGITRAICARGSPAHTNSHLPPTPPTLNAHSLPAPTQTFSSVFVAVPVGDFWDWAGRSSPAATRACTASAHRVASATQSPRDSRSVANQAANRASPANLSTSPPRRWISSMAVAKHAETTLRASSPVNPATLKWHIRSSPSDPGEDDPDDRGDRDLRARSSPTSTGLPSKDRSNDDDDDDDVTPDVDAATASAYLAEAGPST